MASQQAGCIGGMIAVVFTSVVAPVLVAVITQHLKSGDGKAGPAEPGDKGGTVARPAAQPPPAPRLGQAAPGFLVTAAPEQARPPAGRSGPAIAGTAAAVPLERERPQAPH